MQKNKARKGANAYNSNNNSRYEFGVKRKKIYYVIIRNSFAPKYEYLIQRKTHRGLKLSPKEMLLSSITNMRIKFYKHNILIIF